MSDYSYGVSELVNELDIPAHVVRTHLRGLKVDKNDGKYQWSKKSEFASVIKDIKARMKSSSGSTAKANVKEEPKVKKSKKTKDAGAAPENKAKKAKKKKKAE